MSSPSTRNFPPVSDYSEINDPTDEKSTQPENLKDSKNADPNKSTQPGSRRREVKFTRGEKCLFSHLIVTFGLLLLLFIMYIVHLYVVKHPGYDMFDGILRTGPATVQKSDYMPVGMVYVLPDFYMCNSLLLRPTWSIAPAHCVAARSDPDLAHALPNWRITYGKYDGSLDPDRAEEYIETMIIRSVAHPHFNRDDFQNNVGLFQHEDPIEVFTYANINDVLLSEDDLKNNVADLKLIAWEDSWHMHGHVVQSPVQPLSTEKCKDYVAPILDLRAHEYCLTLKARRNVSIAPGAVLAMKSEYVGIFAWGDSNGKDLPFVILDLAHYKNWILHIISIYVA